MNPRLVADKHLQQGLDKYIILLRRDKGLEIYMASKLTLGGIFMYQTRCWRMSMHKSYGTLLYKLTRKLNTPSQIYLWWTRTQYRVVALTM